MRARVCVSVMCLKVRVFTACVNRIIYCFVIVNLEILVERVSILE